MKTYDFIALGGGSAGFNAARVAAGLGLRTAVIDGARDLSGLCILKGCMPSKTLLYMADVLHLAQKGKTFGLRIPSARADMKAIHARKKRIIGEFAASRLEALTAGRTVVVVAHRLSTAARCDRVAVVDAGRILELGPHEELVALGGRYASLFAAWSRTV